MRSDIPGFQGKCALQAGFGFIQIPGCGSGHRQIDPSAGEFRVGGKQSAVKRFRGARVALPHFQIGKIVQRLAMIRTNGQQVRIGLFGAGQIAQCAKPDGQVIASVGMTLIECKRVSPCPDRIGKTPLLLPRDALNIELLRARPIVAGAAQFLPLLPALSTWEI